MLFAIAVNDDRMHKRKSCWSYIRDLWSTIALEKCLDISIWTTSLYINFYKVNQLAAPSMIFFTASFFIPSYTFIDRCKCSMTTFVGSSN